MPSVPFPAATMREMFTAGVASAHTGIPMHRVVKFKKDINTVFGATIIAKEPVSKLITVSCRKVHLSMQAFGAAGSAAGASNTTTAVHLHSSIATWPCMHATLGMVRPARSLRPSA